MPNSNVDVFHTATQYTALRENYTVKPEVGDAAQTSGVKNFYDLFYGDETDLARRDGILTLLGHDKIARKQMFGAMSVQEIKSMADRIHRAGQIGDPEHALMGLKVNPYPYVNDPVYQKSPLAQFARAYNTGGVRANAVSWIQEYESQLRFLLENGADAATIDGTTNILQQLHLQQVERAMYAAFGLSDDDDQIRQSSDAGLENSSAFKFSSLKRPPLGSLVVLQNIE